MTGEGEMTAAPQRVTMAAIAAAAEVSVPTVSRVLNGRADVSAETRLRVESALGELGYARTFRRKTQPTRIIDLVCTELSPWATEIISGASKAALAAKCRVARSEERRVGKGGGHGRRRRTEKEIKKRKETGE